MGTALGCKKCNQEVNAGAAAAVVAASLAASSRASWPVYPGCLISSCGRAVHAAVLAQ